MSPSSLRRYRAERLLRKDFSGLRSRVLAIVRSQLRGNGVTLDLADLEACYAEAWHGLYATVLEGQQVENPSAWLVTVTFRRAIDESRSASRRLGADAERAAFDASAAGERHGVARKRHGVARGWHRAGAFVPDLAASLDDRARLRQVFEGLRTRLSARECEAASLCYLQGLSRAEAAEQMGISDARMRKLMEGGAGKPGVAGKVGGLLDTIKDGGWCEQQSSLMRAFAFGVLDPSGERHALALAHCRECPACRAHVATLRGLASVLPLPSLSRLALAGASGTTGDANAGGTVARPATGGRGATTARPAMAGRAATTARRLATTVRWRGRSGATGSGWGGLGGSLTAKLTVTAVVLLGAGYGTLGSHAHGSRPLAPRLATPAAPAAPTTLVTLAAPEINAAPGVLAGATHFQPLFEAVGARVHGARRHGRSAAGPTSPLRSHANLHSPPGAREFLPEHVRLETAGAPPGNQRPVPAGVSAALEFGPE